MSISICNRCYHCEAYYTCVMGNYVYWVYFDKQAAHRLLSQFQAGDSLTSFIARADEQLYQAKRNGRNRVLPL